MSDILMGFVFSLSESEKQFDLSNFWNDNHYKILSGEWTQIKFLEKFNEYILCKRLEGIL